MMGMEENKLNEEKLEMETLGKPYKIIEKEV